MPIPFAKRLTIETHLGLGTPVGLAGMMLEYFIVPGLSVAGGAGLGSGPSNRDPAFHGALAARARPGVDPHDHDALVLEAAFSTGGHRRFHFSPIPADGSPSAPEEVSATWAHFLQFAAAYEHRSDKGLLVRIGGGLATMLNPGALRCEYTDSTSTGPVTRACESSDRQSAVLVVDFAVGQSF